MMNNRMAMTILLTVAIMPMLQASELKAIKLPEVESPVIDGKLIDKAWTKATKIETFYAWKRTEINKTTELLLCRDDNFLLFGFKCTNPRLKHVALKNYKHDGPIYDDESVEILVRPSIKNKRYLHFALSVENVSFEIEKNEKNIDESFFGPWRGAVKRGKTEWTAEIAIPFFVLKTADLSTLSINIVRNFADIKLATDESVLQEKILPFLPRPNVKSAHDLKSFIPIKGLDSIKITRPFMPRIKWAKLGKVIKKNNETFYSMRLVMDNSKTVSGKAKLLIIEESGGIDTVKFSKTILLAGRTELNPEIPINNFNTRIIKGVLVDPVSNEVLFEKILGDSSFFKIIKDAFTEFSYYSYENNVRIKTTFGFSPKDFGETVLQVKLGEKTLKKLNNPGITAILEFALDKIPEGNNRLTLSLNKKSGNELARVSLNLLRLPPLKGETKADQFKGIIVKDGKPFFPIGIFSYDITGADEFYFKAVSDANFNTLARFGGLNKYSWQSNVEDFNLVMENAKKYNLQIINMPNIRPVLRKPAPFNERLKKQQEIYDQKEKPLIEEIKIARNHPNLLGYYSVDEPNLQNPAICIEIMQRYYKTVKKFDPRHVIMILFSSSIPPGKRWTEYGEMLGFDIYPRPGWRAPFAYVGERTLSALPKLILRAGKSHKVPFLIPLLGQCSNLQIALTDTQIFNQTYLALILGTKGMLYYLAEGMALRWKAVKELCGKVKEYSPALLNDDVKQKISYSPGVFDMKKKVFPAVIASFFKHPDGYYLLLMANTKRYAVESSLAIAGLKSHELLHSSLTTTTNSNFFNDKFEACGVRAWKLYFKDTPKQINASIRLREIHSEILRIVHLPHFIARLRRSHNFFPNPCFEHQSSVKGLPDFFSTSRCKDPSAGTPEGTWCLDKSQLWNGKPSLKMVNRKRFPAFGSPNTSQHLTLFYPPKSAKQITFSFYAKAAKDGDRMMIVLRNSKRESKTFTLTTSWKRYSLNYNNNAEDLVNVRIKPPELSTAWINGFQAEKGPKATKWQDNSQYVY